MKKSEGREAANSKSRAVLNKHSGMKKSIKSHAEVLGAIDEAMENHKKHISKNSPGPSHHQTSKKHMKDIEDLVKRLEGTISDLQAQCKQLKAHVCDAHCAHESACK